MCWHIKENLIMLLTHLLIMLRLFLHPCWFHHSLISTGGPPWHKAEAIRVLGFKTACSNPMSYTSSSTSWILDKLSPELLWGVTPKEVCQRLTNTSLRCCLCRCFFGVVLPPAVFRRLTDGDVGGNLPSAFALGPWRSVAHPLLMRSNLWRWSCWWCLTLWYPSYFMVSIFL